MDRLLARRSSDVLRLAGSVGLLAAGLVGLAACDQTSSTDGPSLIIVSMKHGLSRLQGRAEVSRCHPTSIGVFSGGTRSGITFLVGGPPVQTTRALTLYKCLKASPDVTYQAWQTFG